MIFLDLQELKNGRFSKKIIPVVLSFLRVFLSVLFFFEIQAFGTPPITIDLLDPKWEGGRLITQKGGIIQQGKEMRIQAERIIYTKQELEESIEAEGNLVVQYKGRIFIGERFYFNLFTKEGFVEKAISFVSPFYLSSNRIDLCKDGTFKAANCSLTTCENIDSTWDLRARSLSVTRYTTLKAEGVTFCAGNQKLPFPPFSVNLRREESPVFTTLLQFDKLRPKISLRYLGISWQNLLLFLRLDYLLPRNVDEATQWKEGFGGAVETEYYSKQNDNFFITKSYLANTILINDPDQKRRYRLQGKGCFLSEDKQTQASFSWDKYSDIDMPQDFRNSDFEVDTRKRTELITTHATESARHLLYVHPKVNHFETLNQDLPTFYSRIYPLPIGTTGILADAFVKGSYLDYSYASNLSHQLSDYRSLRGQLLSSFYRPTHLGPIQILPKIGGTLIAYSQTPTESSAYLLALFYECRMNMAFYKEYPHSRHELSPYLTVFGIAPPTQGVNDHYIFNLSDAVHQINQLRVGLKQSIFSKATASSLTCDLYTYLFLPQDAELTPLPRVYLLTEWEYPSFSIYSHLSWNCLHQIPEFANLLAKVTVNENLAFTAEFRYRSEYDWRKAAHENFILDVTRKEDLLLSSPLSDRRMTFLTSLFLRINPFWAVKFQSHQGFYRKNAPPYNECKIDLIRTASAHWKLIFSFQATEGGTQFTMNYQLKR